jgi:hypothetical protein
MRILQLPVAFRTVLSGVLVVATVLTIGACSDPGAMIRKATYPPDFKYVSGQELRSRMNQLAYQVQLLDGALADSSNPAQRQEVLDTLRNIERIGVSLRAGEAGSNHPFLKDFMGNFVSDVSQARLAVSMDPPRYYIAGRVAGGCVNCHKVNR